MFVCVCLYRVASRPGIPGNLEKSGNFVALEKSQGILWNSEKSGNFKIKLGKVREFYLCKTNIAEIFKINSNGEQEFVAVVHIGHSCICLYV